VQVDTENSTGISLLQADENMQNIYEELKTFQYEGNIETLTVDDGGGISQNVRAEYEKQLKNCELALENSCDLWALVGKAVSSGVLNGPQSLVEGIQVLHDTLDTQWEYCFPEIRQNRPRKAVLDRYNALYCLTIKALRAGILDRLPLFTLSNGSIVSLRSLFISGLPESQLSTKGIIATEVEKNLYDATWIERVFASQSSEQLTELHDLMQAGKQLTEPSGGLTDLYNSRALATMQALGAQGAPDNLETSRLNAWFQECIEFISQYSSSVVAKEPSESTVGTSAPDTATDIPASSKSALSSVDDGLVSTPAELVAGLESCIAYFHSVEPANPALIYLAYARELHNKSFLQVIRELRLRDFDSLKESVGDVAARIDTLLLDTPMDELDNVLNKWVEVAESTVNALESGESGESSESSESDESDESDESGESSESGGPRESQVVSRPNISERQQVLLYLSSINKYLSRSQSHSVVGSLVKRAVQVVDLPFIELLSEFSRETVDS